MFLQLEGEIVCESCGRTVTPIYGAPYANCKGRPLGSLMGKASTGEPIFHTSESYMRKYSNIFLKSKEEKAEYRLRTLAERVENLLGLPSYLREDAIKLLMGRASAKSFGALAYAYVVAARMKGNWAISWHNVHKRLKELGIRADIEEMAGMKKTSTYSNYVPRIAEKVAFAFKERASSIGMNPHTYYRKLLLACRELLGHIDRTQLDGHSPFSVAVTLVYLSEHEQARREGRRPLFTQAEIATLTEVSIYTIRETGCLIRRLISDNAASPKTVIEAKV